MGREFGEGGGGSYGCGGDEGVGAEGEAADGDGVGDVAADEGVEDEAGEARAFGVECGGAAVDVVVGLLAGGEGEAAEAEGESGEEVKEIVAVGVGHRAEARRAGYGTRGARRRAECEGRPGLERETGIEPATFSLGS